MAAKNADYLILEDGSPEELGRKVREMMRDSYVPQGGVAIAALGDDSYLYAQAMVSTVEVGE